MDVSLPKRLEERVRWETAAKAGGPRRGGFVLYWMHHALRGHENPALDTAIRLARQNSLPLLVYQGVCEDHPSAADRHHAFVLQGARDVQRELAGRGIRYAFHLQRRGARGPHLRSLVGQAAIVVTEETPVEPIVGWLERLSATTTTPILSVDTSCIVPMPSLQSLPTGLEEFRAAAGASFAERVGRGWSDEPADCQRYEGALPFDPLDLQDADLAKLIGLCAIDHTVAPVIEMPGGSRAGYGCWEALRERSSSHAAALGGDGMRQECVRQEAARIGAYLHYGMISPMRIAREAQRWGAEELLDELLMWRELSHHLCFHLRDAVASFASLPAWARQTLKKHERDPRPAHYSWERLARARSGDPFWDVCQRSLLRHGQLDPAARMQWAKSVLAWVGPPERALQWVIDLNHRYALDGRDPHAYGRLLWGFGWWDQPRSAEIPIYGTVRPSEPARQVADGGFDCFATAVDRPVGTISPRIAIVGAGMAGLVAARTMQDHGLDVRVFEEASEVGGRMATRQTASGTRLDHGAQYFTVCDDSFARCVRSWIDAGIVAPWIARIVELRHGIVGTERSDRPRYVGVPGMHMLARYLAADLQVHLNTPVAPIRRCNDSWQLVSAEGHELGDFEVVIASCPAPQAARLLPPREPIAAAARGVEMSSCWAGMVELHKPLGLDFDAAFVHGNPLGWISRNDSKPRRRRGEAWILHATAEWSEEHLEDEPGDVLTALLDAFAEATGAQLGQPISLAAHRWRYARPVRALDDGCLWDPCTGLGACGDWCAAPRVEGAFLSGAAMAGSVLRHLTIDRRAPVLEMQS